MNIKDFFANLGKGFKRQNANKGKGFLNRDLIEHGEGRLTYVQFFGFLLILFGIVYFAWFLLPASVINFLTGVECADSSAESVAIAFFLVMLGVSFGFPDMLKGHSGDVSTMRIVVFMLVNVICMLLLKVGWEKKSLADIGLDSNWVGIIAFLFGAKAAQAYFERVGGSDPQPAIGKTTEQTADAETAKLAVKQHSKILIAKFPNIQSVSDTVENGKYVVALYVSDSNVAGMPDQLEVTLPTGEKQIIPTFIVPNTGGGVPHHGGATSTISDSISPTFRGSICCQIRSTEIPGFRGVITSGHIFTKGRYRDYGGFLDDDERRDVLINGSIAGKLHFQRISLEQDLAIVALNDDASVPAGVKSFGNEYHDVSNADLNAPSPNVTIISREGNTRDAYIIDHDLDFPIRYGEIPRVMQNLTLIGSAPQRLDSKTVSLGGDSGSCVFMKSTNRLIGMLVGGNDKFSFVLPVAETLSDYNFKTI